MRNPAKADMLPPPITLITSLDQLPANADIDAIVNLAGEPIGNGLWTEAKRRKILDSRIDMTGDVVAPDRAARTQAGGAGERFGHRLVRAVAGPGADGVGKIACLLQP